MRGALPVLAALVVVVVACRGSDDADATGAAEGGACTDGKECGEGLYCLVNDGASGVCRPVPAACAGQTDCRPGPCANALAAPCGPEGSSRCKGILGRYAITCRQAPRLEGQSCSKIVTCELESFCRITDESAPGTCVKLPAGCSNNCDCIEAAPGVCPSGTPACSVVGLPVAVVCQ